VATKSTTSDLPANAFSGIQAKLEEIINSFDPAFLKLSPEQRKAKNAVGMKRKGFIEMIYEVFRKNLSCVPPCFDRLSYERNIVNSRGLIQLQNSAKVLVEYIRNAEILISNEAYRESLALHRYLREAANSGVSGAKPIYDRLKKQFQVSKKSAGSTDKAASNL
jgi:hypothetical protein